MHSLPWWLSRLLSLVVVLGGLATSGCTERFPDETAPTTVLSTADIYLIEPGNRLRITVFNETNLSGDFVVDPAGNISMPLTGNIQASGITARALATRIEQTLKKGNLLNEPHVAVEIQTFRPFYVLGEVRQPGQFDYSTGMTVLGAIARAGGYDYRARKEEVILVRTLEGAHKEYRATERTPILPGDIIKVTERRF